MSKQKVTYKTLVGILEDADNAAANKSGTIKEIKDKTIMEIVDIGSEYAIKNGIPALGIAAFDCNSLGVGRENNEKPDIKDKTKGALAGAGAAMGTAVAGGNLLTGVGVGSSFGTHFAVAGAAAGSPIPVLGPIIGAAVGLGIGVFVGVIVGNKQKEKKIAELQAIIAKQNGSLKKLKEEVEELRAKKNKTDGEIRRLKYIIGVLASWNDVNNMAFA